MLLDEGFIKLFNNTVNLLSINFCGCMMNDASIIGLEKCTQLKILVVQGCKMITDAGITGLVKSCRQLETIDISGCSKVTNIGIIEISKYSYNLKTIDMMMCFINDYAIIKLSKGCRNLKVVKFSLKRITDKSIISLSQHCTNLEELHLDDYYYSMSDWENREITDNSFISLAQNCRQLKDLRLGSCANITDASIIAVAQYCKKLQVLFVSEESCNITKAGFLHLKNCTQLNQLRVPFKSHAKLKIEFPNVCMC